MRNGALGPNPTSRAPTIGPEILPTRNGEPYAPATLPRIAGGDLAARNDMAETVNMVEPNPPMPRKMSSCGEVWAKATKNIDKPIMLTPEKSPPDSPKRIVARPDSGASKSRAKPKIDTTADTPNAPTPNDLAYCGNTGVIIPKPMAMMNAAAIR